jgi:acetyl-CoA carboxylase biotin carboxyl carrier protein
VQLDFNELRELLAAIGQTDIAELTLKSGDLELTVRKTPSIAPRSAGDENAAPQWIVAPPTVAPLMMGETTTAPMSGAAASAGGVSAPAIPPESLANEPKYDVIASPMVGTFYRAAAPGEPSFVEVGDRVRNGQTVCIIEAFKVMNELEAEVAGEVVEILVENGQAVEFGQSLMKVKPV